MATLPGVIGPLSRLKLGHGTAFKIPVDATRFFALGLQHRHQFFVIFGGLRLGRIGEFDNASIVCRYRHRIYMIGEIQGIEVHHIVTRFAVFGVRPERHWRRIYALLKVS